MENLNNLAAYSKNFRVYFTKKFEIDRANQKG